MSIWELVKYRAFLNHKQGFQNGERKCLSSKEGVELCYQSLLEKLQTCLLKEVPRVKKLYGEVLN